MESLSPLVRNSSVRRLSLELVQKFATNLLTSSPVRDGATSVGRSPGSRDECRRVLDVFESTSPLQKNTNRRRASICTHQQQQHSPLQSPFSFNVKTSGGSNFAPKSPFIQKNKANDFGPLGECSPENIKRLRKSSMVTCHVIPPTPSRRRASLSFSPQGGFCSSPGQYGSSSSPNKENDDPSPIPARRRSSVSSEFGQDLEAVALRMCGLSLRPQEILGRGSFGTVVAASYKGREVAVKVLRHVKNDDHLKGELNGLHLPQHQHIVSVLDIIRIPPDRGLVLLERMEQGNLLALINDSDVSLRLDDILDIVSQIAGALSFCHSHGILHLDVKPQNILLGAKGVKLSDFGNSRNMLDLRSSTNFTKLDGTVGYKAPELFKGDKPTEKCDVYSLGVTMWQLWTREQPYLGETEHSVIYKVVAQGLRPKALCSFHPRKYSLHQQTFIQIYETAWNGDPLQRQSMLHLEEQLSLLRIKYNHSQITNSHHETTTTSSISFNLAQSKNSHWLIN